MNKDLIKAVNFSSIGQYKDADYVPVLLRYGEEAFEIVTKQNKANTAWALALRIFYYKCYLERPKYLETLFDKRLFATSKNFGLVFFSGSSRPFRGGKDYLRETYVKFSEKGYALVCNKGYNNLACLSKVVRENNLPNIKLYVIKKEDLSNPKFRQSLSKLKKDLSKLKRKPKIKKGNLVTSFINRIVLTDQEKLANYVKSEFHRRRLIGDIVLDEDQEKNLEQHFASELTRLKGEADRFKPSVPQLFVLGLVRYAMRNYNKSHSGDFWPHFQTDYQNRMPLYAQTRIHDLFKEITTGFGLFYPKKGNNIDKITMHGFVSDHCATKLFDFLFGFWRIDLARNVELLNDEVEGPAAFKTLIDAMKDGAHAAVMAHTAMLLESPKTGALTKSRVKRILRLIDEAFWADRPEDIIKETGNRINRLLLSWMHNPKSRFQEERREAERRRERREKGDIMFHSPTFSLTNSTSVIKLNMPGQRLPQCTDEDYPIWYITDDNSEIDPIEIKLTLKQDSFSYYVEKASAELPLHMALAGFVLVLKSGDKEFKKYHLQPSEIRFFDEKKKWIDHKVAIVPEGLVTIVSSSESYPSLLDGRIDFDQADGVYVGQANLEKGQIVILDDGIGLQAGQRIAEGFNEKYPKFGASLRSDGSNYAIYAELPKLLFKTVASQINGISLIINGKQNRISDHPIKEFKLENEVDTNGYLIDLKDYIGQEGVYRLSLSFPKMKLIRDLGSFAYIRGFNFKFKDAPYLFESEGEIIFDSTFSIRTNQIRGGSWKQLFGGCSFSFNFAEKNPDSGSYCPNVIDRKLKLSCAANGTEYDLFFDIPALFWRFSAEDEWYVEKPADIPLKAFKSKMKKLFVSGPFNFSKSTLVPGYSADIAEEENSIKYSSGKVQCFELSRIYEWFRNNRSEHLQPIFINIDGIEKKFFSVVCRSQLNNVDLVGDFEKNLLVGKVDIEGDSAYTVTVKFGDKVICVEEPVINGQFTIETEFETGDYSIYVYETEEDDDDDGFDTGANSIPLNREPIIRKIINLGNLSTKRIRIHSYQDVKGLTAKKTFKGNTYLINLVRTSYAELLQDRKEPELYGIYNEAIDISDEEQMNKFLYYWADLAKYGSGNKLESLSRQVLIVFTRKTDPNSIIVLSESDSRGEFGPMLLNSKWAEIISPKVWLKLGKDRRSIYGPFDDERYRLFVNVQEAIA